MAKIKKIDIHKLKEWLEKDEAILIDVREPSEHKGMNITGAINLPLVSIKSDKIAEFTKDKNKKIVFHCQAGMRSEKACNKIIKENPDFDIYSLDGGIEAWNDAKFEVNIGSHIMPLNRQVQCFAALFILVGYFIQDITVLGDILILIPGIGLAIAGLFGNCLMMPILAKMPWNQAGKNDGDNNSSTDSKKPSCRS